MCPAWLVRAIVLAGVGLVTLSPAASGASGVDLGGPGGSGTERGVVEELLRPLEVLPPEVEAQLDDGVDELLGLPMSLLPAEPRGGDRRRALPRERKRQARRPRSSGGARPEPRRLEAPLPPAPPRTRRRSPEALAPAPSGGSGGRATRRPARSRPRASRPEGGPSRGAPARSASSGPARAADEGFVPGPLAGLTDYLPDWVKAALALMSVLLAVLLAVVLVSRRQLAQALRRAHSDVVTGLPNRAAVDEAVVRMVGQAERRGTPLAVAMLDIDHFKTVNDHLGHAKGDEVLAAVGAAARREVRVGDFVGRFGGEELLLLLPETDEAGALAVAEKLRLRIGRLEVPGTGRAVTASFGVAAASGGQAELRELVPAADAALYRAKEKGRDRCELASAAAAAFTAV